MNGIDIYRNLNGHERELAKRLHKPHCRACGARGHSTIAHLQEKVRDGSISESQAGAHLHRFVMELDRYPGDEDYDYPGDDYDTYTKRSPYPNWEEENDKHVASLSGAKAPVVSGRPATMPMSKPNAMDPAQRVTMVQIEKAEYVKLLGTKAEYDAAKEYMDMLKAAQFFPIGGQSIELPLMGRIKAFFDSIRPLIQNGIVYIVYWPSADENAPAGFTSLWVTSEAAQAEVDRIDPEHHLGVYFEAVRMNESALENANGEE